MGSLVALDINLQQDERIEYGPVSSPTCMFLTAPVTCPRSGTVKFCIISDALIISDQILFMHVHGTHWLLWDICASKNTICLIISALKMQQLYKNKPLSLFVNALLMNSYFGPFTQSTSPTKQQSHQAAPSGQASSYSLTNMLQSQTRQNNSLAEIFKARSL